MPDRMPVTGGGFWPRPQRGGFCAAFVGILCFDCAATPLLAATDVAHSTSPLDPLRDAFSVLAGHDMVALALTLGSLGFAVVTSMALLRARRRLADGQAQARDEVIAYNAEIDRLTAFLRAEPQVLVAWAAAADEPEIVGDPTLVTALPDPDRLLAFGSWLAPNDSVAIESAVDTLRTSGVGFAMLSTTQDGRPVEAEGRIIGGRAILRFKEVSGVKRELADVLARFRKQTDESAALRALIEALPSPVWARDEAGKVDFVNAAYARAVEAKNAAEAVERGLELLDLRHAARSSARTRRRPPMPAGCRPSSPAPAASSTCSRCRRGAAAPASPSTRPRPRRCGRSSRAWSMRIAARSISCRPASRSSTPISG